MSLVRIKSPDWAVNEKLTSAQQNALDTNVTNALDKRSGQTDTLSSVVSVASGGAINMAFGSTFDLASGVNATINSIININNTTIFGLAGSVSFGNSVNFGAASATSMYGTVNIADTSTWYFGLCSVTYSATTIQGTCNLNLGCGSGSILSFDSGSTVTNSGTTNLNGNTNITSLLTLSAATTATNFTMGTTNRVKLTSRQLTRTVPAIFTPYTSGWSLQSDAAGTPVTTLASNQYGGFQISMPDGAVINSIKLYVEGGSGHAGAPANLPLAALYYKRPSIGGGGSVLASQGDVYGSAAAYENIHTITLNSISHTVAKDISKLILYFQSESGANAQTGYKIHGAEVTFTVTSMDDGQC